MSWRRYLGAGLGLGALICAGYFLAPRTEQVSSDLRPIPPLPAPEGIRLAFNHAQSNVYTDPYRNIERYGDDLEAFLIDEISQAQSTVEVAVQELNLPGVALALAERQQTGVQVRLILENTYTRDWGVIAPDEVSDLSEDDADKYSEYLGLVDINGDGVVEAEERSRRDALVIVSEAGIPWLDDRADGSRGSGLMHHKFVVIDGETVIAGSANFTISGTHGDLDNPESRGNANHLVAMESRELAVLFQEEFELMWGDGPGGETDSLFGVNKGDRQPGTVQVGDVAVTVHFSPGGAAVPYEETSGGLIQQLMGQATAQVDLAHFVFTDEDIAAELLELPESVVVRGVFDRSFSSRDFSQTLTLWGIESESNCHLDLDGGDRHGIGVANLMQGDKLHHKFAVIDPALPRATVITGSHNWSDSANRTNDETLLVLESPEVAAHFEREFERLYTESWLGVPSFLVDNPPVFGDCPGIETVRLRVNLNLATQEDLERLPGIGPALAERIIDGRPYRSLQDLDAVPGIGAGKISAIETLVTW